MCLLPPPLPRTVDSEGKGGGRDQSGRSRQDAKKGDQKGSFWGREVAGAEVKGKDGGQIDRGEGKRESAGTGLGWRRRVDQSQKEGVSRIKGRGVIVQGWIQRRRILSKVWDRAALVRWAQEGQP